MEIEAGKEYYIINMFFGQISKIKSDSVSVEMVFDTYHGKWETKTVIKDCNSLRECRCIEKSDICPGVFKADEFMTYVTLADKGIASLLIKKIFHNRILFDNTYIIRRSKSIVTYHTLLSKLKKIL